MTTAPISPQPEGAVVGDDGKGLEGRTSGTQPPSVDANAPPKSEHQTLEPWVVLTFSTEPGEDRCLISSNCTADGEPRRSVQNDNGGKMIAHTLGRDRVKNARLIAAVPDLLHGLTTATQLAEQILRGHLTPENGAKLIASHCRDVIASATGAAR